MKSPRPWSYHQKAMAVATSSASSALAMRFRSSVRWATRVIVAAGSRGARRRRNRGPRPCSVTVVLPGREASAGAVGRAGLVRAGAGLGDPGLLVQLRGQVAGRAGGRRRRRRRGHDLATQGGGLGGVLGADVVVLHALHLALEDAQRAAQRAGGVRQLLVAEEQQDRQDDQADLQRAEIHWSSRGGWHRRCYAGGGSKPAANGDVPPYGWWSAVVVRTLAGAPLDLRRRGLQLVEERADVLFGARELPAQPAGRAEQAVADDAEREENHDTDGDPHDQQQHGTDPNRRGWTPTGRRPRNA